MKSILFVLGAEFLILAIISYNLQLIYPDSFFGGILFMLGGVIVLGIDTIIYLLALVRHRRSN